jgi:diguanylate cyclase (GGDEF)-like protein
MAGSFAFCQVENLKRPIALWPKRVYHARMIRKHMQLQHFLKFILALLTIVHVLQGAPLRAATTILNVDQNTTSVDITDFGKAIVAPKSTITIQGPGDPQPVDLNAKGQGPEFYWSLYSVRNSGETNLDLVIAADPLHFSGSGLLRLAPFGNNALGAMATAGPDIIKASNPNDKNAFSFTLLKGQSLNIAIEGRKPAINATLWQRSFYDAHMINLSFLLGLELGVTFLLTLGILALYSFRPHAILLVGWIFAFASLIFMVFEAGLLSLALQRLPSGGPSQSLLRAAVETGLSVSLLLCVLQFTTIRKVNALVWFSLLIFLTVLCANFAFAFVDADRATSIARFAFALIVVLGFVITAWTKRKANAVVDGGFLFWICAGLWTILAGVLTQWEAHSLNLSPILLAALALVIVSLVLALLRYIFTQGLASKPFITDANRRSLALSSARHVLWDWQVRDRFLDVGEELPKSLGFDPRTWARNAEQRLLEIMHPVDASAYQAELDGDYLQSGRNIDLDLRLRNSEGSYHWFELRSRVVPGPNQMPDRCIGTLTDVTKQKEAEERLLVDAVHDPITGLPTRALFMDRAERELNKPIGLQLRMLLIDLDRFKVLNEALGHDQGDRLLQAAGARIQDCLSEDESVSRFSGSQFAVLAIEAMAQRTAYQLAQQIMEALEQSISLGQQNVSLAASIGISNASERGIGAHDMQAQAASALLEARRLGGAQIVMFDKSLKDDRASELALESELRAAMSSDQIEVHFQPICRLVDLEVAGLEALARWRHPTKGLLPPLEFINLAEQAGMIGEIGQIVLASAARQLGVWQRVLRREGNFFVSVNISPSHFLEANFLEQVQDIIRRESLKPNSLKIEVTESVIMRHPERALRLFERLRSLGVGLACDDFGTGFSNLSSIRDLPFDTLKIDRSFLSPESFDARGGMVITTIADLAHGLGMAVVAEGIENQAQIDRLAHLGCDLGQGYFIGEPKPAKDITDMLAILPRFAAEPLPGEAPLAPRLRSLFDPPQQTLEVLPSIFPLPRSTKAAPKKKPKVKKAVKRSRKT